MPKNIEIPDDRTPQKIRDIKEEMFSYINQEKYNGFPSRANVYLLSTEFLLSKIVDLQKEIECLKN